MINKPHIEALLKELEVEHDNSPEAKTPHPMSTQLHTTLSEFEEVEFPAELHGRIMRSVYLTQFKTPLTVINAILGVNFAISSYQLWRMVGPTVARLAENGSLEAQGTFSAMRTVLEAVPASTELVFGANLALLAIGGYLLVRLRSMLSLEKQSKVVHN